MGGFLFVFCLFFSKGVYIWLFFILVFIFVVVVVYDN